MQGSSNSSNDSVWDQKRRAPFHFLRRAENARFTAYVLWEEKERAETERAEKINYTGTSSIALSEGFVRESSIAIELILKALICLESGEPPPATHDVYNLWQKANLANLCDENLVHLTLMTETLYWSGRYAAPNKDEKLTKAHQRLDRHEKREMLGNLRIRKAVPFTWEVFDEFYSIAQEVFTERYSDPSKRALLS